MGENKQKKVFCPVCKEEQDESLVNLCTSAHEYIIETLKKEHPDWQEKDGACPKCVEYYKNL
ncbi:MAG: hypothetical protein ABSE81_02900 [Candidatus Omnitrophota bacterium]|jgi:hypothetical protein